MKFKVPRVFYIKGKKWTLKFADLTSMGDDGEHYDGLTDTSTREVLIEKTLKNKGSEQLLQEVVLHEVFHCFIFELHFTQIESFNHDTEEILCDGFADLVHSTLMKYFYK